MLILTINPGSTSTKIGIFNGKSNLELDTIYVETVRHSPKDLSAYPDMVSQLEYRKTLIEDAIKKAGFDPDALEGFIGRGGLLRPIESGVYEVNENMIKDLTEAKRGVHASNLGGILTRAIAVPRGKKAYIADPVVVDELCPVARISGHPLFKRVSVFHALNQKAIARKYCWNNNLHYDKVNLIVAHMGGGISVGAHENGKVIDVNNALDGDGPFSPERSGTMSMGRLIELCFSGEYTETDIRAMIQPKGGLMAHLGTNDLQQAEEMAKTDKNAALILDGMYYRIAKEIGAAAVAISGKTEAVLLTGGMAHSKALVEYITERVSFIAKVFVYPGEDELLALATAALRVLSGEEMAKVY